MSEQTSPTTVISRFIAGTDFKNIPTSTIQHLKACILDGLGCGLYGSRNISWILSSVEYVKRLGGAQESTVWGSQLKVPAVNAVMPNTMMVNGFELDDTYVGLGAATHPACIITPVAMAVSEREKGITGKEFLTAVAVGYETMVRFGSSICTPREINLRGHGYPPSIAGAIGATATTARLIDLEAEIVEHALHISGSQAAGLYSPTFAKRWCLARASQGGIMAADITKLGCRALTGSFEMPEIGLHQYFALEGLRYIGLLTEGLGRTWNLENVALKAYSCNRGCHTTIDAIKALVKKHPEVKPDSIKQILIEGTHMLRGYDKVWEGKKVDSVLKAIMNFEYVATVTLFEGQCFVDQFTDEKVKDPKIQDFMKKVKVRVRPEFDNTSDFSRVHVIVTVTMTDGRMFSEEVHSARGESKNPLTLDERLNKFRILAQKSISGHRSEEIIQTVNKLEDIDDVSILARLLTNIS